MRDREKKRRGYGEMRGMEKKRKGRGLWKDDERQGEKGKREGSCEKMMRGREKGGGAVNCTLGLEFFLFILGFFKCRNGWTGSVRFGSIGFRFWKPKPNRTGIFLWFFNRLIRFFFVWFFRLFIFWFFSVYSVYRFFCSPLMNSNQMTRCWVHFFLLFG
jgi:hypothetical protein